MGAAHKRTWGVQVVRRGTGRSAVHSGASAGCCGQTGRLNVTRSRWKNYLDVYCVNTLNFFFFSPPHLNSDFGEFHLQHGATLSPFRCFSLTVPSEGRPPSKPAGRSSWNAGSGGGRTPSYFYLLPRGVGEGRGRGQVGAEWGPAAHPPSLADVIWAQASARPLRLQYATPL